MRGVKRLRSRAEVDPPGSEGQSRGGLPVSPPWTMTIDFAADAQAIIISLQLDHRLAERVFADAEVRGVRACDVVANALHEYYARVDLHPGSAADPRP